MLDINMIEPFIPPRRAVLPHRYIPPTKPAPILRLPVKTDPVLQDGKLYPILGNTVLSLQMLRINLLSMKHPPAFVPRVVRVGYGAAPGRLLRMSVVFMSLPVAFATEGPVALGICAAVRPLVAFDMFSVEERQRDNHPGTKR